MAKHFLPEVFGRSSGNDMFSSLQREIDNVFKDFGRGLPAWGGMANGAMSLKLNVAETDKALEITADLPGVDAGHQMLVVTDAGEVGIEVRPAERPAEPEEVRGLARRRGQDRRQEHREVPEPDDAVAADAV